MVTIKQVRVQTGTSTLTHYEQVMAEALAALQRPVRRRDAPYALPWLCTECGGRWEDGAAENHYPTCATGIARAARVACGLEPV